MIGIAPLASLAGLMFRPEPVVGHSQGGVECAELRTPFLVHCPVPSV